MAKTIGERIRELRNDRGMTQKELGERAGIAEPTIRRYELGKLNPKFETVQKIAKALEVPTSCVYGMSIQNDEDKQNTVEKMLSDAVLPDGDVDIEKFTESVVKDKATILASELVQMRLATGRLYESSMQSWTDEGILTALGAAFKTLNRIGKIEALNRVDELAKIPDYQRPAEPAVDAPGGADGKEPDKK